MIQVGSDCDWIFHRKDWIDEHAAGLKIQQLLTTFDGPGEHLLWSPKFHHHLERYGVFSKSLLSFGWIQHWTFLLGFQFHTSFTFQFLIIKNSTHSHFLEVCIEYPIPSPFCARGHPFPQLRCPSPQLASLDSISSTGAAKNGCGSEKNDIGCRRCLKISCEFSKKRSSPKYRITGSGKP